MCKLFIIPSILLFENIVKSLVIVVVAPGHNYPQQKDCGCGPGITLQASHYKDCGCGPGITLQASQHKDCGCGPGA